MNWFDLEQVNLEQLLAEHHLSERDLQIIRDETQHFDRYLIIKYEKSIGFIRIWRQSISDPYSTVQLDDCDLINFKGEGIPVARYIDVLDEIFQVPQLTRCSENYLSLFGRRGFRRVLDKKRKLRGSIGASSVLLGVIKKVTTAEIPMSSEFIRRMAPGDIAQIQTFFFDEYRMRYRAVPLLYSQDNKSCFVYDQDGEIKGVILAQQAEETVYIHQIFVRKEFRGVGIDRALLNHISLYANGLGKDTISGTVRGNLVPYYDSLGISLDLSKPKSHYVLRLNFQKNTP